ncbi:MAG: AraC-like DNA-binding protein [Sediminicola sp.]|jgi:AraC-like DNA-binding protein
MNPLHFKVPRQTGETVKVETWNLDYFYDPIHFHDEFQLTYVIEGEGSLFVREISKSFKSGDVLLFGKNLPHVLRCHDSYYQGNPNLHARAVSVFFSQDTLKETLAKLPEAYAIQRLIEYAIHGIKVPSEVAAEIGSKLERIIKQTGFERVLSLLDVLHDVSNNENLEFISSSSIPLHSVVKNIPKIEKVFEHVSSNFKNKISLEEIASVANMTPTGFCRFFKQKTLKTFSRFLIEVRIGNACKMLVEGDYNTSECCFASGYNNISNFHRHFRSVTKMAPTEYRAKFQKTPSFN